MNDFSVHDENRQIIRYVLFIFLFERTENVIRIGELINKKLNERVKKMNQVTFKGEPVNVSGNFVQAGTQAPEFTLTSSTLSDIQLAGLRGKKLVLNIFPSIDTPVCAASVRKFNESASSLDNTVVLCISADLPFAAGRFCEAEGLEDVQTASFFRSPSFTEDYGVNLNEGALKGLSARAVIVVNEEGLVTYSERVSEITEEPNYELALEAVKQA